MNLTDEAIPQYETKNTRRDVHGSGLGTAQLAVSGVEVLRLDDVVGAELVREVAFSHNGLP